MFAVATLFANVRITKSLRQKSRISNPISALGVPNEICRHIFFYLVDRGFEIFLMIGCVCQQWKYQSDAVIIANFSEIRTSDRLLNKLSRIMEVKSLNLGTNRFITDASVSNLTSLTELFIQGNYNLTENSVSRLKNLRTLDMKRCIRISSDVVVPLTNLTSLKITRHWPRTLSKLTKLQTLDISSSNRIATKELANLTNLTSFLPPPGITDRGLTKLRNLATLHLFRTSEVSNKGLLKLSKLTTLNLCGNLMITDKCLSKMTNLTTLDVSRTESIHDAGISTLSNLQTLDIAGNGNFSDRGISELTSLTVLDIYGTHITDSGLVNLSNITALNLSRNKGVHTLTALKKLSYLCIEDNPSFEPRNLKEIAEVGDSSAHWRIKYIKL